MTRLRDLFDEAAGTPPPHTLSADTVYAAGMRRRTLVTAARSALAVVTVAAVAGAAYGAVRVAGAAHVANGDTRTSVASLAVDGDHMYALVRDCVAPSPTRDPVDPGSEPPGPPPRSAGPPSQPPPSGSPSDQPPPSGDPSEPPASGNPVPPGSADPSTPPEPPDEINPGPSGGPASCRARLLGSDDAGRTWKVRSDAPGMDWIAAPRHGVLVGGRDSDRFVPGQRVSADGGRTWRTVTLTGDTVPAVPAGAYVDRIPVGPEQKVVAVDPRTGRATPLASQPGFSVICVEANPAHSLLVATGLADEKTTQSAKLGVSRDGGRSHDPAGVVAGAVVPRLLIVEGLRPHDLAGRLLQRVEVTSLGADEDHSTGHGGAGAEPAGRLVSRGRLLLERPRGREAPGIGQRDRRWPGRRRRMARREQIGGPVLTRRSQGHAPVCGRRL